MSRLDIEIVAGLATKVEVDGEDIHINLEPASYPTVVLWMEPDDLSIELTEADVSISSGSEEEE